MGSWSPVIVGNLFIAVVLLAMVIAPRTWWAKELRRSYGVRPTGTGGRLSRADYFRSAGAALLAAIVLVGAALGVAVLADWLAPGGMPSTIAQVYSFGFVLLGGVALLSASIAAWNGLWWRDKQREARSDDAAV